jgi:carboxymethylenebutenolidase
MRPQLNDLQEYLAEEFVEEYQEGRMSRRDMVKRLLGITGGVAATATLLLSLGCSPGNQAPSASPTSPPAPTATPSPPPSPAAGGSATPRSTQPAAAGSLAAAAKLSVPAGDPSVQASDVTFAGGASTLMAYLAQPKGSGPFPGVLVCHENRGLTDHIRDVTRRLAKAGYAGLALDLLSRQGGTAKVDPAQVPGLLGGDPSQAVDDFKAAFTYLQSAPSVANGKVGMVGFCFGGGITWLAATAMPDLKAAVPYYGPNPPIADVPKIQAPVLAIYGELDQRIDAGIPAIESAMKASGKTFEKVVYPGANHAFNNDTGASYDEQAAVDAWAKTLDWFHRYLG